MIYIASKVKHADKWLKLREQGVPIISTWIDEAAPRATISFNDLWVRCITEASMANCLIAYRENGETPKGMLLEIGASLSHNKWVFLIGFHEPNWTFKWHSNVVCVRTLEDALILANVHLDKLKKGTI